MTFCRALAGRALSMRVCCSVACGANDASAFEAMLGSQASMDTPLLEVALAGDPELDGGARPRTESQPITTGAMAKRPLATCSC